LTLVSAESLRLVTSLVVPLRLQRGGGGDDIFGVLGHQRDGGVFDDVGASPELWTASRVPVIDGTATTLSTVYKPRCHDAVTRANNSVQRHAHRAVTARHRSRGPRHATRGDRGGVGWEPPISTVVRVARRDCDLGGVAIPTGTNVSVRAAAANRDPAHYPDPDRFDPTRKNIARRTFGGGPHVCLGMPLARMETTVAISALLDRLPDLHLDPSAPPPSIKGVAFRSPAALSVEFTRA